MFYCFLRYRYIAVCHPLRASTLCTKSKARRGLLAILIFAAFFSMPQILLSFRSHRHYYTFNTVYFLGLVPVFMYFVPLTILIVITFRLRSALRSSSEQRISIQNSSQRTERYCKITMSLFVLLTVFILCQSINFLANVQLIIYAFIYVEHSEFLFKITFMAFVTRHVFIVFNSSVNVLIYVYFSKHYSNLVHKHVILTFRCNK